MTSVSNNQSIFVQIPSYRDAECTNTVSALFARANHPERIFVGICLQVDRDREEESFHYDGTWLNNVRVSEFDYRQSQGVGWARNEAQKLYQNEDFVLQIDAHSRFEAGWDELLFEMLAQCPGDKKLLSHYPASFYPPDRYASNSVPYLYPAQFNDTGMLIEKSIALPASGLNCPPIENFFIAAGLIFAPSRFFKEVPPDPNIYFWGEQLSLAVRAWTRGWRIFSPSKPSVYHIYHSEAARPLNWQDNPNYIARRESTKERVNFLLGMDSSLTTEDVKESELLTLGTTRSLADYQSFAGIDFKKRQILTSMANSFTERLIKGGAKLSEYQIEWYKTQLTIDQISFAIDNDHAIAVAETFLASQTNQENRCKVKLFLAKRFLDQQKFHIAEHWSCMALADSVEKSNAYSLIGRIRLRQQKYDSAKAALVAACSLAEAHGFESILPGEPHPLTLLALNYCRSGQADKARETAIQALDLDARYSDPLKGMISSPDNSIGKDLWLFPERAQNFKYWRAQDTFPEKWQEWIKTRLSGGTNSEILGHELQDFGFKKTLVDQYLNPKLPDIPGSRAVVAYLDDKEALVRQAKALYQSLLYIDDPNTDLIVFGPESALEKLPNGPRLRKVAQAPYSDSSGLGDPSKPLGVENYRFINSIACFVGPGSDILREYKHLLKSDVDCFLTPAFNSFHSDSLIVGKGGYSNDDFVKSKCRQIAEHFGLIHREKYNLGSTIYGESHVLQDVCKTAVEICEWLIRHEFKVDRGVWPSWYAGVASMYATEIALNHHVPELEGASTLFDHPSYSDSSIYEFPHIHCWHSEQFFSKFAWMRGEYDELSISNVDVNVIRDYCLFVSQTSDRRAK